MLYVFIFSSTEQCLPYISSLSLRTHACPHSTYCPMWMVFWGRCCCSSNTRPLTNRYLSRAWASLLSSVPKSPRAASTLTVFLQERAWLSNCLLVKKVQSLSINLEGHFPDELASLQDPHITTGSWSICCPLLKMKAHSNSMRNAKSNSWTSLFFKPPTL